MAEPVREALQIHEDPALQAAEWRASSATWIVLLAIMAAAVLGAFGDGPLSRTRVIDPAGLVEVEYQRFGRFGRTTELTIDVRPQEGGEARVTLARSLVEAYRIEAITPEPDAARSMPEGLELRFTSGAGERARIRIDVQPRNRWTVEGAIGVPGAEVRIEQFIYP